MVLGRVSPRGGQLRCGIVEIEIERLVNIERTLEAALARGLGQQIGFDLGHRLELNSGRTLVQNAFFFAFRAHAEHSRPAQRHRDGLVAATNARHLGER